MERKNNYYTPEIEEFHFGFIYEKNEPHRVWYEKDSPTEFKWVEKTWNEKEDRLGTLMYKINDENIRVKYLDREDIESFGFKTDPSGERYYELEEYQLHVDSMDIDEIKIYLSTITIYSDSGVIFNGTIKNKSEFKKLLIQLGIYETTTK